MAWTDLKNAVAAIVKTNGNQEITGANLQATLFSIIDNVGENATYKGIATPSTSPGTPDGKVFYLASEIGIYPNFGGEIINEGITVFTYDGGWSAQKLFGYSGFLVDALVENWAGAGDEILYINYVYKNDATYNSGVRVFKSKNDLSSPVQVAYWQNLGSGKTGLETISKKVLANSLGDLTLTVDWSKLPDPYNAVLAYPIIIPNKSFIASLESAGIQSQILDLEAEIAILDAAVAEVYALTYLFTTGVSYDTYTPQVTYDSQDGGKPFGDPFSGWGAEFNKVGISFNAIKIPALARLTPVESKKWVLIQAVIQNAHNDSTPIALSPKIGIDSSSNVITDIILPLMDPTLENVITLDDSSFSGGSYFIGYCFYAADGSYAFGGNVGGVQSNYAGESYFITNKTFEPDVPATWSGYSDDPCIPMEHALLTGVEINQHLIELDEVNARLDALEAQVGTATVEVVLPDTIHATVGDTLQIYFRSIIKAPDPYIYDILVSCSEGKQYPRYFEYTPVIGDIGTTTFKVDVKNKDNVILGTKTVNLVTKNVVQSPSTDKHILCVGDSLTSAGTWCQEASRRLIGSGGSPAGLGLTNLSFLGRKTGGGIGWEGNGGWTWESYATAGREAYRFQVSGVITAPAIDSVYFNNGNNYTIAEINITAGTGEILGVGSGTPTASGVLTKVSGSGDASINFSSQAADAGNPFWDAGAGQLGFPDYVNTYMSSQVDAVYFLLTWNGQSPWKTDFSSVVATAKTLIDHIHANYPSCKIKIMGIQLPSLNGGMGANYGATGTSYADTFGNVITALNMNKAYQDWCNEPAYSSFMEYVDTASQFDSENNMPESDKVVNVRASKTEKVGTNGVHPSTAGYYQMGDTTFRSIISEFCQ